jgi:hypothetical protein
VLTVPCGPGADWRGDPSSALLEVLDPAGLPVPPGEPGERPDREPGGRLFLVYAFPSHLALKINDITY